jgi:hypothetical protein
VEIVQAALEHFATTGEPDWDGLHEDVEVYDHDIMDAGDYRGARGLRTLASGLGVRVVGVHDGTRGVPRCG